MNHLIEMLSPASAGSTLWPLLVECATKGTAVLAVAALAALLFHRASAARRHLVWALALGGLAVLPVMLAALPEWKVRSRAVEWIAPAIPAERLAFDVTTVEGPSTGPTAGAGEASRTEAATPDPSRETSTLAPGQLRATFTPAPRPLDWRAIAVAIWLLGVALVLATFATGHLVLRALLRDARIVRDGEWHELALEAADRLRLTLPFALLRGRGIPVPVAFGIVRPRVLLPPEADEWPIERRRSVLLHELAHVQRRDCATQAIAQLACAIFWFHPLAWWASSRLRVERELACDDRVLASATRPSDYADHLLDVVRSLRATRLAALGAVAFAKQSSLEGRLLAVLDPQRDRRAVSMRMAVPAALLATLVVLPLAALEPARVQAGVHEKENRDEGDLADVGVKSLPPSIVLRRTATDASLDDAFAWARKEAAKANADVWWVGWQMSPGTRESGGFLSDTQGFDLEMLGKQGLLSLDDILAGRTRGTTGEITKGKHSGALLLRMDRGVPNRVRIQSLDMPAEFGKNQPLYWFENVTPEHAFAWIESEASRTRNEDIRARLVESAGYLDRPDLTEPFLSATLEGNDSEEVRKHATKALGLDPSPASLRLLRQHARTDRSSDVRRAAVEALGRHQTPEALDALIDLAGAGSDNEVRRAAFDAMGQKLGEERDDEASKRAEAEAQREEAKRSRADSDADRVQAGKAARKAESDAWQEGSEPMKQADLDVQRQAIESLGRYPEAQSLPRLKRLAESAPNEDLRRQAVESIGRLQTKASNAVIEEVLWKNRMEGARNAAVEAIARNQPEDDAIVQLERVALSHPSTTTRRMAVEQIGRFESPRARQILLKTLNTSDDLDSQRQAVESLGRRGGSDVTAQLMQIVKTHPSVDIQRAAVEALGKREDDGGNVERLVSLARDEGGNDDVRRQAVESLGRLADPRVKDLLLDLANKGPSVDVQRQAVESLGRLDGDEIMADLAELARNHPIGDIRRQAVESMAKRDPDKALPKLEEILKQQSKRKGTL